MKETPDRSVHLVVTSPPYWQLKDYGNDHQIGFHDTYERYINNLNLVWKECHRVLHDGCRLCINIGDQFARAVYYGRYKVIPIRTEIIKFCETVGFDYMGAVIWQKVTTCHTTGGATIMGSFPYPRNGILKLDYEFILLFKKHGDSPKVAPTAKEHSKLTTKEWNQYFSGHWDFPGEKQGKHLAMFPKELPRRLIKMFSFVGETVLDPFLGSGTTSLAAKNLDRDSIGYEINAEFLPVIREKLAMNRQTILHQADYLVSQQDAVTKNVEDEIEKLPYIFSDPLKMDKKIDPRKLQFGSRIDGGINTTMESFTAKEVVSPEIIVLNNGLQVRLLGVKERPAANGQAVTFLRETLRGQRIFLKYDAVKYDEDNTLLCYLYLWNKTFVNAHLIKRGLADVDLTREYKYKEKFLSEMGSM